MDSIWMLLGLIIAGVVALIAVYRQWRAASPDQRTAMIVAAVQHLVEAAEELYKAHPQSGEQKFAYVMHRLRQMFPGANYDQLAEYVKAAVYRLNAAKVKTDV